MSKSEEPSAREIRRFLDVFYKLSAFEAHNRELRGYGLFRSKDLPDPNVAKTLNWLHKKVEAECICANDSYRNCPVHRES